MVAGHRSGKSSGRYQLLKEGLSGKLEKDYLELLYKAGTPMSFQTDREVFTGIIKGVSEFGELEVLHQGEIRTFAHGAISMELNQDLL